MVDMMEKANRIEEERDQALDTAQQAIRERDAAFGEVDSLKVTIRTLKEDHAREVGLLNVENDTLREQSAYDRKRADEHHAEHIRIAHTLDIVAATFSDAINRSHERMPRAPGLHEENIRTNGARQ